MKPRIRYKLKKYLAVRYTEDGVAIESYYVYK